MSAFTEFLACIKSGPGPRRVLVLVPLSQVFGP
jgi:hypothetical protein